MDLRRLQTIFHIATQHGQRRPPPLGLADLSDSLTPNIPNETKNEFEDDSSWFYEIDQLASKQTPAGAWLRRNVQSHERKAVLARHISQHLELCQQFGATYLTLSELSRLFPSFASMPNPPLALTILGKIPDHLRPAVAIVGSRRASMFALKESFRLGRLLTDHHITVVSGGAYGCDIAAHRGCLSSQLNDVSTIVVVACGLGCLYPRAHLSSFRELVRRGGFIVSERLWYQEPRPYDFPNRNRLITALSCSVAIIHVGLKSGAMTTCQHALDQGKSIHVLSPPPLDRTMEGNAKLISDGASMFYCAEELLRYL